MCGKVLVEMIELLPKTGHAGSCPRSGSSIIGDPGGPFRGSGARISTKKEKEAKRKKRSEGEGLWKLPQPWKSTKEAFGDIFFIDFPRCLKKPAQKTLRLFHSYAQGPAAVINS